MSVLARFSLANRALIALITGAIALLGVVSLGQLKQELIPSLQFPTAIVVATYPGAAPDVVEDAVSVPLEEAVRGVDDVESVSSQSSTNMSLTTVQMTYGTDMDAASAQLQAAVSRISSLLPQDVDTNVFTGSIDDLPVIQLAVSGDGDEADLTAAIEQTVLPRLEKIDGIRSSAVTGAAEQQVLVVPDLQALAALSLDPTAVGDTIEAAGLVLPAGEVDDADRTLSVTAGSALTSVEDIAGLPLAAQGADGATVGDVAEVVYGPAPPTSYSRLDGEPALAISVTKTPAGNTVEVSAAVTEAIAELEEDLPGTRIEVVFDQAPFITESIEGLTTEGLLGLVFAIVVILLFLASLRSTLVSAISIPLSLLVTFILMNVTGYTLNILTLGALTISIGRVVDDSIVVIENIKRHLSYGEAKSHAILGAVREVGGAITSSTIATIAVFVPIALVGGSVGELFRPFAVTVAIAMLASLFVALTIVPVLAYWFIREPLHAGDEDAQAEARAAAEAKERRGLWQRAYVPSLRGALAHPVITIAVSVGIFAGTLALVPRLETNFLGDAGQNTLTVTTSFAPATSLETQDAAATQVEEALADIAEIETMQTTVGSSGGIEAAFMGGGSGPSASFALTLAEDADTAAVEADVREALGELEDIGDVSVAGSDAAFGSSTVDLVIQSADIDVLEQAAAQVAAAAAEVDGAAEVANNLAQGQPAVQVTVDQEAAAAAGLTETQVVGIVSGSMYESNLGTVDLGDGRVDVLLRGNPIPQTLAELRDLSLPTAAGLVPLTDLASVEEVELPTSISRIDGARSATVAVTPAGQDLGSLTSALTAMVDDLDLPAGASVEIGGVASDQEEAFADLGLALVAAIAIVFIVMVATFNSLVQPLILLVSVPFAATGALILLLVSGTPLGVASLIGMLMLVGIVVSNAIVLIDLINQYRSRGRTLREAIDEGARKRLRPIVMTALATIFALTPMALGVTGGGAFISQPLALVVIGGLLTSTLLTLIVVPVLYLLIERGKEKRADKREAKREAKRAALRSERGADGADTADGATAPSGA